MSVKMRQEVERKIVESVIKAALKAGFSVSVDNGDNDGNEYEIVHSRRKSAILKAMFQTDEDRIYLFNGKDSSEWGWVYFVYGNDGWDVISDYTINLESLIGEGTATDKIAEYYAD